MTDDYQRFSEALNLNPQELISLMNEMSRFLLYAMRSDFPCTTILMDVPIAISVANEWCAIEVGIGESRMRVRAPASLIEGAASKLAESASMLAQYLDPTDKDELN